jgi:hypothetical protein
MRRKQPIGDGKGITNGLMTTGPTAQQLDMIAARERCSNRGGVFDPRTGECLVPTAPPSMVKQQPPQTTTTVVQEQGGSKWPLVLGLGAGAAVLFILFRKER